MVHSHKKINDLRNGWYVVFKDDSVLTEDDGPWSSVSNKNDIRIMGLKWKHKQYELRDKDRYTPPCEQKYRDLSISNGMLTVTKPTTASKSIGYYDSDCKVILRVDMQTGKIVEERIPY